MAKPRAQLGKRSRISKLLPSHYPRMIPFLRNNLWLVIRCAIYAWAFTGGVIESAQAGSLRNTVPEQVSLGFVGIMAALFGVFMFFIALMVSAVISLSSLGVGIKVQGPWVRPSHASCPFTLFGPPLAIFHFGSFTAIAIGLGLFCGGKFSDPFSIIAGSMCAGVGIAMFAGLHFGMACCQDKFHESDSRDADKDAAA